MLLSLFLACAASGPGATITCEIPESIERGVIESTLDGVDWVGQGATWMWAGSDLQINTESADGWRMSAVARTTTDGASVEGALLAQDFPIQVALETGDEGGFAVLYPDEGDSYSTEAGGGGSLIIIDIDVDELWACVDFPATGSQGTVQLNDGMMRAVEF